MNNELARLVKHSGIYGLGTALSKSVGFIMIPVYTRFLTPKDYGILELLDLAVFVSTTFAAMGMYAAVFRFYSAYESDEDKKEVIATAILYSSTASLLVGLVLIYWGFPIAGLLLGNTALGPLVRIVGCTFFFSNVMEVPLAYWRAQGRTTLFVSVGLVRTLTAAMNLVVFLVILKMGIKGALYANLVTNGVWGVTLLGIVLASIPWRISRESLCKCCTTASRPSHGALQVSFLLFQTASSFDTTRAFRRWVCMHWGTNWLELFRSP